MKELRMALSRRQSLKAIGGTAAAAAFTPARAGQKRQAPIRLIALDVGGTIIPDHGEVPTAMQAAFATRGLTVSASEIAVWRGASKRELIRHFVELRAARGLDRTEVADAIYKRFNELANDAYAKVRPIAGAEAAIATFKRRGYIVVATTGFGRALNDYIFRRLGWQELFAASITSDDVAEGRPAPYMLFHAMEKARVGDVAEVVAVGDTPLDLEAAHNGGMHGIGVLTGAGTRDKMEHAPHTMIVASIADVPSALRLL
jgi:phosphonatase-like hydrolase